MILADSNFWMAMSLSKHEFHGAANDWFKNQSNRKQVVFCRSTQQSLLRLLTTESLMRLYGLSAMTNRAAWNIYEELQSDPIIGFVKEPNGIEARWKRLCGQSSPSPKLWMDTYLAAFALSADYAFVTTDKGFKQFKELKLVTLLSH